MPRHEQGLSSRWLLLQEESAESGSERLSLTCSRKSPSWLSESEGSGDKRKATNTSITMTGFIFTLALLLQSLPDTLVVRS